MIIVIIIINEYCITEDEQDSIGIDREAGPVNLGKILQRRWLPELSLKSQKTISRSYLPVI